jgi:hypothetical protein
MPPVPKIPVAENGNFAACENNVWLSRQCLYVLAIAQAVMPQELA